MAKKVRKTLFAFVQSVRLVAKRKFFFIADCFCIKFIVYQDVFDFVLWLMMCESKIRDQKNSAMVSFKKRIKKKLILTKNRNGKHPALWLKGSKGMNK